MIRECPTWKNDHEQEEKPKYKKKWDTKKMQKTMMVAAAAAWGDSDSDNSEPEACVEEQAHMSYCFMADKEDDAKESTPLEVLAKILKKIHKVPRDTLVEIVQNLYKKLNDTLEENDAFNDLIIELQRDMKSLKKEKKNLEEENQSLHDKYRIEKHEFVVGLQTEIEVLNIEKEKLIKKLKLHEKQVEELNELVDDLNVEVEVLKIEKEHSMQSSKKYIDNLTELLALRKENIELKDTVEECRSLLLQQEAEIFKAKFVKSAKDEASTSTDVKSLKLTLEAVEQKKHYLEHKLKKKENQAWLTKSKKEKLVQSQGLMEKVVEMQGRHVHRQGVGYCRYERARKSKYLDLPSPIYCGTCEKLGHSSIKGELAMDRNIKYVHSHSYLTKHSHVMLVYGILEKLILI
ncbi:hypothetical protein Dimus_038688 [Dionaea muscipula]